MPSAAANAQIGVRTAPTGRATQFGGKWDALMLPEKQ
jgi:hypothetical protein